MNTLKTISLVGLTAVLAFSCNKSKETEESAEMAQQNSIAESSSNELQNMSDEVSKGPGNLSTYNGDCVTVTYDTTGNETNITIDFGTVNCLCADGKNRRGKILINYSGNYGAVGTVVTATTDEYFVNENKVLGERTATRSDDYVFDIQSDLTIELAAGGTLTWSSTRQRTQTEGTSTPFNLLDNVYTVTGNASGETAQGKDYNIEVTSALTFQLGCRYIKEGVLEITSSHLDDEAIIDYGDGTCDNKATLSYGNKTKEITL